MVLSKEELFAGIRLARPLLILFICIAHMPGIEGYQSSFDQYNDLSTLFAVYLKDFLARGAVPILTVVSGYLAVSSFRKQSYGRFVFIKVKRLFIPFIVWNIAVLFACWGFYVVWGMDFQNISNQVSFIETLKAIIGIYRLPINAPTYFLRDLFVLMLLMPLLHFLCQSMFRLSLFSIVYLLVYWNAPGIGFYVGDIPVQVLIRLDMPLFFCVGYYFALHNFKTPKVSIYSGRTLLGLMAVLGILFSMVTSNMNPNPNEFVQMRALLGGLFVSIAPAILLGLLRVKESLPGRFLNWLSPYSFTLFLSHILSAYIFMAVVRFNFGWGVKESSPIYEQILYMFCYLSVVVFGAVVLSFSWKKLLSGIKANRANKVGKKLD